MPIRFLDESPTEETETLDFPEEEFQQWYSGIAQRQNLDADPDHPEHYYDWRAAYSSGVREPNTEGHFPSQFKLEGHPREIIDGVNTRTGQPVQRRPRIRFLEPEEPLGRPLQPDQTAENQSPENLPDAPPWDHELAKFIPFRGIKDAAVEGYKSAQGIGEELAPLVAKLLPGPPIVGKLAAPALEKPIDVAVGSGIGAMSAAGTAFNPVMAGASTLEDTYDVARDFIEKQAAGTPITPQMLDEYEQKIRTGFSKAFPEAKPEVTESVVKNFLSDLTAQALNEKFNTALLVLGGVEGGAALAAPKPIIPKNAVRENPTPGVPARSRYEPAARPETILEPEKTLQNQNKAVSDTGIPPEPETPAGQAGKPVSEGSKEAVRSPDTLPADLEILASQPDQPTAKAKATELLAKATDEEVVRAMSPENDARMIDGQEPVGVKADGTPDFAAQEFLRRVQEARGKPGDEGVPLTTEMEGRPGQMRDPRTGIWRDVAREEPVAVPEPFKTETPGGVLSTNEPGFINLKRPEIVAWTDEAANAARQRLRGKIGANPFLDPIALRDHVIIAANLIEHGARNVARFTEDLVKQLGEEIRPHAEELFNRAKAFIQEQRTAARAERRGNQAAKAASRSNTAGRKIRFLDADEQLVGKMAKGRERAKIERPLKEEISQLKAKPTDEQQLAEQMARGREDAQLTRPLKEKVRTLTERVAAGESDLKSARREANLTSKFLGQALDARDSAVRLVENLKSDKADSAQARAQAVELVKDSIPYAEQGRFITAVKNAKNGKDVAKLAVRVYERLKTVTHKRLITDLKKTLERASSGSVAVEYRQAIGDLLKSFSLVKTSKAKLGTLRARQAYIRRMKAAGKPTDLALSLVNDLATLEKKPLADMSIAELELLNDKVQLLEKLGRTKQAVRSRIMDLEVENISKNVAGNPATKARRTRLFRTLGLNERAGLQERLKNFVKRAWDKVSDFHDLAITPMDAILDMLDGAMEYSGPVYRNFKTRIDRAWNNRANAVRAIKDDFIRIADQHELTQTNFKRIGVWAALKQEGGVVKLNQLVDAGVILKEDVISIARDGLSAGEMEMYQFMRKELDLMRPQIETIMRDVHNRPLEFVDNYFPWITDFDAAADATVTARLEFAQDPMKFLEDSPKGLKFRPDKGFTESRVPAGRGKQLINLDARDVFLRHLDDAQHLIHFGRDLEVLGRVSRTPEIRGSLGDVGQQIIIDWLDVVARDGGSRYAVRFQPLDVLRTNVGVATLGAKLSTILIQSTALLDAVGVIGPDGVARGMRRLLDPKARKFLDDNMAEVRERIGGDPAYAERSGIKPIRKLQDIGMKPIALLDREIARGVALGAYEKFMKSKGRDVDYSAKPDAEALEYAQRVVRRTQASQIPKDLPPGVTTGRGFKGQVSISKAFFQYQNFLLNRWSLLVHDGLRTGLAKRSFKPVAKIVSAIALSDLAAVLIRHGLRESIQALFGTDDPKKDKSLAEQYMASALGNAPFVSNIVQMVMYGESPLPALGFISDLAKTPNAFTSKSPEAKARGVIGGGKAVGKVSGIPFTEQGGQLLEEWTRRSEKKPKSKDDDKMVRELLSAGP